MSYPSFIGSTAISLPGKIQDSLLLQSSDAKQVVLQLQETLQPDQTSLKEPGPETKQLIRCLARAAKDLNRSDVFEHLREITPAGTTGESDSPRPSMFPEAKPRGTLRSKGNKTHCFPREQTLSVLLYLPTHKLKLAN